jgi:tetratricopeptide (TPR) repeat protein
MGLQVAAEAAPRKQSENYRSRLSRLLGQRGFFALCTLALVAASILRSSIATRLDGFTMDEAYHIAAGVSYVRNGDFRINPEHPPLVKLWVGSFISSTGFHLSAIRKFTDKPDERDFTEEAVFLNNDFESVQRRARLAMFALNGLLLVALGFALRRAFGSGVALGTVAFLAIDPTVAAHLPVVMTDLPISLLSATAIVLAIRAFQGWKWGDLAGCSAALGLALGAKHSAPIFFIVVILAGIVCAFALPVSRPLTRPGAAKYMRFPKLFVVALGAMVILWGLYGFRYSETHSGQEAFNRPLADKIADLHSPSYRGMLTEMAATHVAPRAYIWGFADTLRAGFERRGSPITAFGRAYVRNGPGYFFPGVIALKLPIGLGVLVLLGLCLYFARQLPREWNFGLGLVLAALLAFMLVLAAGSTYGGIRHALPAVVLLAIFAGCAISFGLVSKSRPFRVTVALLVVAAAASALPVMRPWEYFNELIGGAKNGYLYFNDEGVDCWQRSNELAEYYHQVLEPTGEIPVVVYPIFPIEMKARGLNWPDRDGDLLKYLKGSPTVLVDAKGLSRTSYWDHEFLARRTPTARFGNLLVFRGPCEGCEALMSQGLFYGSIGKMYAQKPDFEAAEQMLKMSIALDPTTPYFVYLQLGNLYLRQGFREKALQAYADASRHASAYPQQQQLIEAQSKRVSSDPVDKVPQLRNPAME